MFCGPSGGIDLIVVPPAIIEAMVAHARAMLPNEACGLLAGDGKTVRFGYPLTNDQLAPDRFTIAPAEHFGAVNHAERRGWEILGVFHSHPRGRALLSPYDIAQAHDPNWVHVVVGFVPRIEIRTWRIVDGRAIEVAP